MEESFRYTAAMIFEFKALCLKVFVIFDYTISQQIDFFPERYYAGCG